MLATADFNQLYRDHASTVYNLCLHYTLNRHDAEDLTQEIFVKVHQYHGRYDPARASLSTWITRIAINHCIDFLKAAKRRRFIRGLFGVGQPIDAIPLFDHPGTQAENRQALDSLLRVIGQLPPSQKTVVILLKIEMLSLQQVADLLGTSQKAVESLFQRAKKNIEKKLPDTEGSD